MIRTASFFPSAGQKPRQRGFRLILLIGLSTLGFPSWADTQSDWLARMNDAFGELSYDGVFTYYSGDDLASLRVVHKVVDGVQQERLLHLNGAPREIVRIGDEVACIVMPGDDIVALEESIPAGPFARAYVREFDRIADTYSVELMGEGRVAGRVAQRLAINPKDSHRFGYRLWLDRATALLLRSELVSPEGARLEVFQFSQVYVGDEVSDEALRPTDLQGSMVSHLTLKGVDLESTQTPTIEPAMQFGTGWLPEGFRMATEDLRKKPSGNRSVRSMMYSDGLASFSIFIEAMPEQGAANMVSRNGATVAITRGLDTPQGYFLATLVGEIPESTGHRIIRSIKSL